MRIILVTLLSILFFNIFLNSTNAQSIQGIGSTLTPSSLIKESDCTTTITSPNQKIQDSINSAKSGDVVCVRSGTYQQTINVNKPGITLAGIGPTKPIIDGDNYRLPGKGIYSVMLKVTANNTRVSNFEIKNSSAEGLLVAGESSNNKVEDVEIDHIYSHHSDHHNVRFWFTSNALAHHIHAQVAQTGYYLKKPGYGPNWGANMPARYSDHITFSDCTVFGSHGEGIIVLESTHMIVERCEVFDNRSVQIYVDNGSDVIIRNNLLYSTPSTPPNSYASGIHVGSEPYKNIPSSGGVATHTTKNLIITNNIIVNNVKYNIHLSGISGRPNGEVNYQTMQLLYKDVLIANNTLVNAQHINLSILGGEYTNQHGMTSRIVQDNVTIANNTIHQKEGIINYYHKIDNVKFDKNLWSKAPSQPKNGDIIADPKLTNPNQNITPNSADPIDYKLTNSSPAIENGLTFPLITTDYFGAKRPHGPKPDIGAHEFGGTPTTPEPQKWDLNSDNTINLFDFSWLLNGFRTDYSFTSLNDFISSI